MRKTKGLTLIELLVIVSIVGILLAIIFPLIQRKISPIKERTIVVHDTLVAGNQYRYNTVTDYIVRAQDVEADKNVVLHTSEDIWGELQKDQEYHVNVQGNMILSIDKER